MRTQTWEIYRKDPKELPLSKWISKRIEMVIKLIPILFFALVPTAITCAAWYAGFYMTGFHFLDQVPDMVVISWITFVGFLYSILTGVFVTRVVDEYKAIRMAIKKRDLETFMSLRDEDVSPMIHGFMTVLALFAIVTFMGFEYPNIGIGLGAVGASTFIFAFIYWTIREFDEPFYGFWFIKNVPEGWLDHDPRQWREKYYEKIITKTPQGTETSEIRVTQERVPVLADDE